MSIFYLRNKSFNENRNYRQYLNALKRAMRESAKLSPRTARGTGGQATNVRKQDAWPLRTAT